MTLKRISLVIIVATGCSIGLYAQDASSVSKGYERGSATVFGTKLSSLDYEPGEQNKSIVFGKKLEIVELKSPAESSESKRTYGVKLEAKGTNNNESSSQKRKKARLPKKK